MSIERYNTDLTTAKERVSFDKLRSLYGLVFGTRALHFNAFLETSPSYGELAAIARQAEGNPVIENAIFDLDGTLVSPYAPVTDETVTYLDDLRERGQNVAIYTNSPHSDRLDVLKRNGIAIAETGIGKPTLEGFQRLCDAEQMDPAHTAMIGNFPITDMPLVPDGEPPFFPVNVLVRSIPPQRELVKSRRAYVRARVFHAMNLASAQIVQMRNSSMIREVDYS